MRIRIIVAILLSSLINIHPVSASNEIALKSRRFTPAKGITAATREKIEAIPGRAHVLIQLENIPTIKEREELEAKGIRLLSYIPNKAWFASVDSDKTGEILAISNVRAISEILSEDKISPIIRRGVDSANINPDGNVNLAVVFFKDVSLDDAEKVVSNYGGIVYGKASVVNTLLITISNEKISNLQNEVSIKWISGALIVPKVCNDGSREAIGVDIVQASPYNLTGTGVIAGEWDGGWVDTTHDDLEGRVTIGDSGSGTDSHATHVAGTMLGDGSRSVAEGGTALQWRGMATNSSVISYEWWDDVDELESEHDSAIHTFGIDIETNSWGVNTDYYGCGIMGDYLLECSALDNVSIGAQGKPISIMWVAGNERSMNGCGRFGFTYNTIIPFGTAKNTITVGATNSNDDSMTDFSSWGPTDDGRIKPDVVAPGCQDGGDEGITSTVPVDTYDSGCGTSMATPAVAGSVALMLEDWRDNHSDEPEPLPSTIKAILIQTAEDLGNTGPDYSHGYGLINVEDAIDLIGEDVTDNVILEDSIFEQGDTDTFTIDVPQEQTELKITLVWDDYPGNPAADEALVNDIDLIVKEPDETRHYPWTLDPEEPGDDAVRTAGDSLNNVEQVIVGNPTSGTWTIQISGTTIPEPAQLYSLTSNIVFDPTPPRAYDDSVSTQVNVLVGIGLKATDDGLPDPPGKLTSIVTSLPGNGTLSDAEAGQISSVPYTLVNDGSQVIYTPDTDYTGPDSFTFKANDGGSSPNGGDSDEAAISIQVFEMVNWWKLDEGSEQTAADYFENNHGRLGNDPGEDEQDPTWDDIDAIYGSCLVFDGDNDYVDLGVLNTLIGETVTISAWIKAANPAPENSYDPIVTQYNLSWSGYDLCLNGLGKPSFYLDEKSAQDDDVIISGEWHHLAGTYDGQELRIYVDGVLEGSTYYNDQSGEVTAAYIGYGLYGGPGAYFDGKIDEVRVYNWAYNLYDCPCMGDLNGDGKNSAADMTIFMLYLFQYYDPENEWKAPLAPGYECMDFNRDGTLGAADMTLFMLHLFNNGGNDQNGWTADCCFELCGETYCSCEGRESAGKEPDFEKMAKWLREISLEAEVRNDIEQDEWYKFIESLIEVLKEQLRH